MCVWQILGNKTKMVSGASIRLIMFIFCMALFPFSAIADSFGGWDFTPPDSYERSVSQLGVTYTGANGGYMFLPQAQMGTDVKAAANAVIDQVVGQNGKRKELSTKSLNDEGMMTVWFATKDSTQYIFMTIGQGDQSSTGIFITGIVDADQITSETEALLTATFTPVSLTPKDAPAFPAMDWPKPPTNNVSTTKPRMSVAQARAVGIDPDTMLLVGSFDCFVTSEPRAMDARPDLRLESMIGRKYSLTDGARIDRGTWAVETDETIGNSIKFSGILASSGSVFISTDRGLGQSFTISHPERDAELTCRQDGPSADAIRQRMAAVSPKKGVMDCVRADGQPFKFSFDNGVYEADGSRGNYLTGLEGTYGKWEGQMTFVGGPFDIKEGKFEAKDGVVQMIVSRTWSEASMFGSSSETTNFATCSMPTDRRPDPVYGPDAALPAKSPKGGLPEGLFRAFENRYVYNGGISTNQTVEFYTWVAPAGRFIEDPDWTKIGDMPDCSRTTPSGEEFCGEYAIDGGMITMRDERQYDADDWDKNAPLSLTATGFNIDGTDFEQVLPPTAASLVGTWSSSAFTGGGPGLSGGIGNYSSSDTQWTFTADGHFSWKYSGGSSTLISADPILGGASGGGSSSFEDTGKGTYTLTGMWLDLVFEDGRTKHLPAFGSDASETGQASLVIDGDDLAPE